MSDPLRSPCTPTLVHFEGAWTAAEKKQIRRAAAAAESGGLPATAAEAGSPWVVTKHRFSSFTLLTASRVRFWSVLTARHAQDLAEQIEAAHRLQNGVEDANAIFQLVYQSRTTTAMRAEALRDLLYEARPKNKAFNITGVLLYKAKRFIQVLEGEEAVVRRLYATIKSDARHTEVETLLTTRVRHRVFPGWTMKLEDLDAARPNDALETYSFLENGSLRANTALIPEIALALERFKAR